MLPNCDNIPVTGDLDSELDFLEQIPETLEDCFKILSTEARGIGRKIHCFYKFNQNVYVSK